MAELCLYTGLDNAVREEQRGDQGATSVMELYHWKIHNGDHYYGSKRSLALADAGTFIVHIVTGTKDIHANVEVASTGKCTIDVYSGTTYTAAGTALTIFNNNGTSAKTTSTTAFYGATTNVLGTQIYEGINNGGTVDTVGLGGKEKIIAKGGQDICIIVTNKAGAAADFGINFDFYEV